MPKEPFRNLPGKPVPERRWAGAGASGLARRTRPSLKSAETEVTGAIPTTDYPSLSPARDDDEQLVLSASERFEQHMAEINRASALLRRALPDLEAWPNPSAEAVAVPKPRPVWLVISVVWISTLALTAMATFAIAVLVS